MYVGDTDVYTIQHIITVSVDVCQSSVYVGDTRVYTIQHIITVSVDEKCVRVQCTLVTQMCTRYSTLLL